MLCRRGNLNGPNALVGRGCGRLQTGIGAQAPPVAKRASGLPEPFAGVGVRIVLVAGEVGGRQRTERHRLVAGDPPAPFDQIARGRVTGVS